MTGLSSLGDAFADQVARYPDRIALCVEGGRTWTYRALATEVWGLAHELRRQGLMPESRVAIIGGRTGETVAAILSVLSAGGAYCIIDPHAPARRKRQILDDLEPAAIVAVDGDDDPSLRHPLVRFGYRAWSADTPPPLSSNRSSLAYVLFTSGSTGRAKGVMVEHGSVFNMLASYDRLAPIQAPSNGALVSPIVFDVSVWEMFSTLTSGATLHIPGAERLSGGSELWNYLCDASIDSAYIPPGLLASLVTAAEQRRGRLKRALVGVEPISQGLLQRFRTACPGLAIVNGYGPTEATITATLHLVGRTTDPNRRTPIGHAVNGSRVEIVDESLRPVAAGETGEIVIFGDCLARGYVKGLVGGFMELRGARAYRTGDYGRVLADGAIEFSGRRDGQVKLDGFRVEIGEVEAALNAVPGVERALVIVTSSGDTQRLVAVVQSANTLSSTDVRRHLAERLPSYAMPSRVLVLRTFPLTDNGKVDTEALAAIDRSHAAELSAYAAPLDAWQCAVAETWSHILGVDRVGIDDDFHQLGGGSLDALRVSTLLSERGYSVRAGAILAARTIRRLEKPALAGSMRACAPPGVYPADRAQTGLWTWRELNPQSTSTTVVHAIKITGALDAPRLNRALNALMARHEALRTTFTLGSDQRLEQHVASAAKWTLQVKCVSGESEINEEIEARLAHRFDVRDKTWSACLHIAPDSAALIFAADHLVFDGESAAILQRDLARAYADETHHAPVAGPASLGSILSLPQDARAKLQEWWRRKLDGASDPPSPLPEPLTLGPRSPALQRIETVIDTDVWNAIVALSRRLGTTTFVTLLAALKAFLRARTAEPDNVVSVAHSRRYGIDAAETVGNLVNLLPIRDQLAEGPAATTPFAEYLGAVLVEFSAAIEHGALPFEDIIAELPRAPDGKVRGVGHAVLVQRIATEVENADGLLFEAWAPLPYNAIYDLTVFVSEPSHSGAAARLEWVSPRDNTIQSALDWLAEAFTGFLRAAACQPDTMLAALPYLGESEQRCIARSATSQTDASSLETLVSLFEQRLAERPDAIAVEDGEDTATYAQLSERASAIQVAIGNSTNDAPIIIVLDKSIELVAAMLATLRAGAPYLPLDPNHSRTRLLELATQAGARACITHSCRLAELRLPAGCNIVCVDALYRSQHTPYCSRTIGANDLAYVMPTSGSTGTPKLVGVPHRAVVRLVHQSQTLPLDDGDCTMLLANSSFDAATLEVWGALANGGKLVVPSAEALRDPTLLATMIEQRGVTAAFFTTTYFERLLDHIGRLSRLKHIIVGGEAVPPRLFARAAQTVARRSLVNGYGPTENTTFSCCYRLDRDPHTLRSLPIGKPISGSGAIVMNSELRPVPPGQTGELLVTGSGLAHGYVNDPELTRQRFVVLPGVGGARAYRTGDLARLLPDGVFEYLGRLDRQLKVNGFRIEPGEVEAVLASHTAVRRSVVYTDDLGEVRALVAAVEATGVSEADLRAWVSTHVPDYLLPARIFVTEQLPMTGNGKLDHAALRATQSTEVRLDGDKPETELEHLIAETVAPLLGLPRVGPNANIFDLGATSMAVLALTARLSQMLGKPIPNHLVYSSPTVRSLAARIAAMSAPPDGAASQRALDRASRIRKVKRK